MIKLKNPIILQLALQKAAEEAYRLEIIETDMEALTIGDNAEYATVADWILSRIQNWIGEVKKKFTLLHQPEEIEVDEKVIASAHKFYDLKLGDETKIENGTRLTRVPGGWVMEKEFQSSSSSVFIPFSDEFLFIIDKETK